MAIRNISIDDMSRIALTIPDDVRLGIADVVIAFARMEARAEELIWVLCGLSFDDGAMLTTMDARPKFKLVRELVKKRRLQLTPELPVTFWETVEELRKARNAVAHGQWILIDGTIPATASFRDRDQHGQRVVADAFSLERLGALSRQSDRVREYLTRLLDVAKTLPPGSRARRPESPPPRARKPPSS